MRQRTRRRSVLLCTLLMLAPVAPALKAQTSGTITGAVHIKDTGAPLPGVNIVLLNTQLGAASRTDGSFSCAAPPGRYTVQISAIGYKVRTLYNIVVRPGEETRLNIIMEEEALRMPAVVVTANKRTQSYTELPISVSVLSRADIDRQNVLTLNESFKYVSGVNVVGGQVNIRNSGGYRRGTGSTVLLMIDGVPLLAGDTGDIKWDAIPLNEIEKVEIVKGAGSALYGTSAMGGVINVITREPSYTPETAVKLTAGMYAKPYYSEWEWTNEPMTYTGLNVSHARRTDRWRINVSGGFQNSKGYEQNSQFDRKNFYAKTRYDFSPNTYLRIHSNIASDEHGVFIQWRGLDHALEVPEKDLGNTTKSDKASVAAVLHATRSSRFAWTLKPYAYYTKFRNDLRDGTDVSKAVKTGTDFQVDYSLRDNHFITAGLEGVGDIVRSDMFGEHAGYDCALYCQDEAALSPRLKATFGFRYDYAKIDTLRAESQLSPKLGVMWDINGASQVRLSIGKGFRYPLISEAFSNAAVAGFQILPNDKIRAESSWSYEIGLKQVYADRVFWDTALFWNEYRDMIEANTDGKGNLRFENLVKARIRGLETAVEFWLLPQAGIRLNYTYTRDEDLSSAGSEPLAYRPRHLFNISPEVRLRKIAFGGNFRYVSKMRKYKVFPGDKKVPLRLFDVWARMDFEKAALFLKIDNLFQYHYAEVERNMYPIQSITLSVRIKV